jgi:hypothetical protein
MASAAKKKLVVCGGNGFLGKQHPQQPPASTQITANTPHRKPHLQSRRAPRVGRNLHLTLRHTALVLRLVLRKPTRLVDLRVLAKRRRA